MLIYVILIYYACLYWYSHECHVTYFCRAMPMSPRNVFGHVCDQSLHDDNAGVGEWREELNGNTIAWRHENVVQLPSTAVGCNGYGRQSRQKKNCLQRDLLPWGPWDFIGSQEWWNCFGLRHHSDHLAVVDSTKTWYSGILSHQQQTRIYIYIIYSIVYIYSGTFPDVPCVTIWHLNTFDTSTYHYYVMLYALYVYDVNIRKYDVWYAICM